jgi:hypothetical protein
MSAIRMTTSGLRRPWAVWKDGRVVLESRTEALIIMAEGAGRLLLLLVTDEVDGLDL